MSAPRAAFWLVLLLAAVAAAEPVEVRDDRGVSHRLEQPPSRVVSLAPNITELVFALGQGAKLVGVSRFCDYPAEARSRPQVGGFADPDLERTLALEPQVVLVTRLSQEGIRTALTAAGITVYTVFPRRVEELGDAARRLGELLGAPEQGKTLQAELDRRFAAVRLAVADLTEAERLRVFLEVDPNPLMTATDDSFQGSLVRLAGGRNIAADLPRSYARIAAEAVIAADPQVIVCTHGRGAPVGERRGWANIDAVRTGRVYTEIDPDLLVRPGPRAVQGAEALLRAFYPERARTLLGAVGAESPAR